MSESDQSLGNLEGLREDIDEIDRSLVALLESRLEICKAMAEVKKGGHLTIRSVAREQEVMSQLIHQSQDENILRHIEHIYAHIFQMCLEVQEEQLSSSIDQVGKAQESVKRSYKVDDEHLPIQRHSPGKRLKPMGTGIIKRNLGRIRWRKGELVNAPRSAPLNAEQRAWLTQIGFAHRGLHDALNNIPENSLPAFEAAITQGFGIELDVHLSADGIPMVFHDEEIGRMTGVEGEIKEYTCAELKQMPLIPGDFSIPTLKEALELIKGQTPILVEIKNYSQPIGPLESAVAEVIRDYKGSLTIQSFNPMSLKWFYRHMPHIVRGLIAYSFPVEEVPIKATTRFLLKNLLFTPICKPHYIAYEHQDLARHRLRRLHRMRVRGTPVLVWTIRTQEQADLALKRADNIIFEGFQPS